MTLQIKQKYLTVIVILALMLLSGAKLQSQELLATDYCKDLTDTQKTLVDKIKSTEHPYNCCDKTIAVCLEQKSSCPLVKRLSSDICRMVKQEKTAEEIRHSLMKRAQSMTTFKKAVIYEDELFITGNAKSEITLTIYACTRCPFCKVLVPQIYELIKKPAFKTKLKLVFKPFPIKGHKNSLEGGMAIMAAAKQGAFQKYMLKMYQDFGKYSLEILPVWAKELGLDVKKFEEDLTSKKLKQKLIDSKKEGIKNKVNATPTIFINGRKYQYELTIAVIEDILLEELENISK